MMCNIHFLIANDVSQGEMHFPWPSGSQQPVSLSVSLRVSFSTLVAMSTREVHLMLFFVCRCQFGPFWYAVLATSN